MNSKTVRAVLAGSAAALLLHIGVGWMLSSAGAVLAGLLVASAYGGRPSAAAKAILTGVITMIVAWGSVVIYNFVRVPEETAEMARIVAALLGDLPAFVTITVTLSVAGLLGAAGGYLGHALYGATRSLTT